MEIDRIMVENNILYCISSDIVFLNNAWEFQENNIYSCVP